MIQKRLEQAIEKNKIKFTLMDIGASGKIHKPFKKMLPFSTLIRFDPDLRKMHTAEQIGKGKILTVNKAIVPKDDIDNVTFYLTKSPFCSSTLKPNKDMLSRFSYAELFEVIDTTEISATTVNNVLNDTNTTGIDWIKLDTQGTDLRILKSLTNDVLSKILVCDIEPGFYDHYIESDTFEEVHKFMVNNGFWLADLDLQQQTRMAPEYHESLLNKTDSNFLQKILKSNLKRSPTATEARYIRSIESAIELDYDTSLLLRLWPCSIYSGNVEFSYNVISHLADVNGDNNVLSELLKITESYLWKSAISRSPVNINRELLRKLKNAFS